VIAPGYIEGDKQLESHLINFDILIDVSNSKNTNFSAGAEGNVNISVVSSKLGFFGKWGFKKYKNINTQQRITFSVPYFPQGIKYNDNKK
jgi:hypothetical protein